MAAVKETLSKLMQEKIHTNMKEFGGYGGPLSQKNPKYFILLCDAISTGIADGSKVINFTSADKGVGGAPAVPGIGSGVGVKVNDAWFDENLYNELRQQIQTRFGSTNHGPYKPSKGDTGLYLYAITKGVAESVKEHFATAYNLIGAHQLVTIGAGSINNGMYSGLVDSNIESLILAAGSAMRGPFWPVLVKSIAKIYVQAIHEHSTGKLVIAGLCIPSISQVCGVNMVGIGTGTAV
jgi:hypothetical protein